MSSKKVTDNDVIIDNIMWDIDETSITTGITLAKSLIGAKPPYIIDRRYDGSKQAIFSQHFLDAFAKALSFNCIADMTEEEKDLYFEYIAYTKDKESYDIRSFENADLVLQDLDDWAMDELLGNEHPTKVACD